MVWEMDRDGIYTYVSPQVKEILGYEPSEVIGRSPFDLMHETMAERVRRQFEKVVEKMSPILAKEHRTRHKNGKPVILESSGVPIIDAEGNLKGFRGIDRDITLRKQIELKLKKKRSHSQQYFYLGNPSASA